MSKSSLFSRVLRKISSAATDTETKPAAPKEHVSSGEPKTKKDSKKTEKERKRIEFAQQQVEKRKKASSESVLMDEYALMMEDSGLTQEELKARLSRLRKLKIAALPSYKFRVYGLYKMSDEDADKAMYMLKELEERRDDLRWDLRQIDLGRMSYEDIEQKVRDYKDLMKKALTADAKRRITGKAGYLHPEELDEEQLGEVAADMEFTKYVLKYSHVEYISFHFHEKTIPERREFICDLERLMLQPGINSAEAIATLDDKLLTYRKLKVFFKRDFVNVRSGMDYSKFERFFERNDKGVIKPRYGMLGKGVRLVRRDDYDDIRELYDELINEEQRHVIEGYIEAADEIRALNPDSVNTVRFITYFDGESVSIRSCSMRIGHAGSFVDNAGAGGMTVAVDKDTGIIISDGCDEKGFRYETHPDTGIRFKGYQLPAWDKALETLYAVTGEIDGAKYIGWDLACNKDYDSVIVEGNGRTGFVGAQAPMDTGRRREFFNTIGADPRGAIYNEIALDAAEALKKKEGIPVEESMTNLRHFESLGLDGRYFFTYRAWELTDEECLALSVEHPDIMSQTGDDQQRG